MNTRLQDQTRGIAKGSAGDLLGVARDMVLPTLAKGVLRRRPGIVGLLETTGLEERAIRRLQALRRMYGGRPVLMSLFGRKHVIVLQPEHMLRVLDETPDVFRSTSDEKSSALAHFEPGVSLISDGVERRVRRDFNGKLLDEGCPQHRLAGYFQAVVNHEIAVMLQGLADDGAPNLDWKRFFVAWNRIVRQVLLGPGARDDQALTDDLNTLRSAGNWAFLHPGRKTLRQSFHHRLQAHIERAEGDSLASLVETTGHDDARPSDQFTHFMFAFDPGGMASFRALALLASHPEVLADLRRQIAGAEGGRALLRASMMESLRLWPTTPVILRQARHDIDWEGDTIPGGAQVVIYAPFFHRDDETLDEAHRFVPGLWPGGSVLRGSRFVPFSEGDGICPARDLVPMVGAMALEALLRAHSVALTDPARLDPARPLPPTLDNYTLEFKLTDP
jgi:cytochrome P450